MPKIKTHKSTSKRFRLTKGGKGKLMMPKIGKSHRRRMKTPRVKRMFDEMQVIEAKGLDQRVRRLAPYLNEKGK